MKPLYKGHIGTLEIVIYIEVVLSFIREVQLIKVVK